MKTTPLFLSVSIRLNQGGVPETPKRPPGNPAAVTLSKSGKGVRFNIFIEARHASACSQNSKFRYTGSVTQAAC